MNRRMPFLLAVGPWILLAVSTALSGCHTLRHSERTTCEAFPVPAPIPPGAPTVQVIGMGSSDGGPTAQLLAAEIQASLAQLGGLRLQQSPTGTLSCGDSPCSSSELTPTSSELQTIPALNGSTDITLPGPVLNFNGSQAVAQLQVLVRVDELIAYSPMRLSTTIAVVNTMTGEELSVIQKTWQAPDPTASSPRRRWFVLFPAHHPVNPAAEQVRAMAELSPATLLKTAAHDVAPMIHAACLMSGPLIIESLPVIESVPSALPEFQQSL